MPQPECGVMQWCCWERKRSALLYRFLLSQCPHKEGFIPFAKDSRGIGEPGRCWSFFLSGPKVWVLANQNGWVIKTEYCFYCWQLGFLWVQLHAFWVVQHASHISAANAKLSQGTESNLLPHLPRWQFYSHRQLRNISIIYMWFLTNLENTIWN